MELVGEKTFFLLRNCENNLTTTTLITYQSNFTYIRDGAIFRVCLEFSASNWVMYKKYWIPTIIHGEIAFFKTDLSLVRTEGLFSHK